VWRSASVALAMVAALASSCGGGGSSGEAPCINCTTPQNVLGGTDVERIIARAAGEAQARGIRAHIAVVDRVGNVLAVFSMTGAPATVSISGGRGVNGGLDGIPQGTIPATHAAISKAITGAYLSSQGNAFSTRTASQIVQEYFNPGERGQPSGPLYGVQFSQLRCSDVTRNETVGGPRPSPLGLSADPGGLPLYVDNRLVGGIGIEADGVYGLDRDIGDIDENDEELVAVAGAVGLDAPREIRGDRITADGRSFRYVDSEVLRSNPSTAPAFATLPGALVAVPGFKSSPDIMSFAPYPISASGIRPDTGGPFGALGGYVLVDISRANGTSFNRFPPRASADGAISASDTQSILGEALAVAQRARAQIRRPLGSHAEVTISVVDRNGDILGIVRTSDGPVFGIDVSVQKARTALFFSHPDAAAELASVPPALHFNLDEIPLGTYAAAFRQFTGVGLDGSIAWTPRAIGNLHRPFYPDGIEGTSPGPLSTPYARWSPFNVGFQLDLVYNQLIRGVLGDTSTGCAGRLPAGAVSVAPDLGITKLRNGAQIFPGGVPIYRGDTLVGAIGVSGDGVDQDDMIAYLGLENASRMLANGLGNAPRARRADMLAPQGVRLRYVQCPQSPFNGSSEQNVCQ